MPNLDIIYDVTTEVTWDERKTNKQVIYQTTSLHSLHSMHSISVYGLKLSVVRGIWEEKPWKPTTVVITGLEEGAERLLWNSAWEKQNGGYKCALIVGNCKLRFRLSVSFEMKISGIIMETFTLGTVVSLNITHNASFYAESVNAAAWNRARLV